MAERGILVSDAEYRKLCRLLGELRKELVPADELRAMMDCLQRQAADAQAGTTPLGEPNSPAEALNEAGMRQLGHGIMRRHPPESWLHVVEDVLNSWQVTEDAQQRFRAWITEEYQAALERLAREAAAREAAATPFDWAVAIFDRLESQIIENFPLKAWLKVAQQLAKQVMVPPELQQAFVARIAAAQAARQGGASQLAGDDSESQTAAPPSVVTPPVLGQQGPGPAPARVPSFRWSAHKLQWTDFRKDNLPASPFLAVTLAKWTFGDLSFKNSTASGDKIDKLLRGVHLIGFNGKDDPAGNLGIVQQRLRYPVAKRGSMTDPDTAWVVVTIDPRSVRIDTWFDGDSSFLNTGNIFYDKVMNDLKQNAGALGHEQLHLDIGELLALSQSGMEELRRGSPAKG